MSGPTALRVLRPHPSTRPSRRGVLAGVLGAGASALLAGCGGASSADGGLGDQLNIYTWGEYDAPSTFKAFTRDHGVKITTDTYGSNEEMIAKLVATQGTSGYDIVVPSSYYVRQMAAHGLLEPLREHLLPNLARVAPAFRGSGTFSSHAVCKDWGTTGYVYDNRVVQRPLRTWTDFFDAAQHEASGKTSLLEDPGEVVVAYFNAHGIDENTTSERAYAAAKRFLVEEVAPHVQAFDSYPSTAITQGSRVLMQAWNGDARQGILASKDRARWTWVLPTPTNRWQDNWAIAQGAHHVEAAHAFINAVLAPARSLAELQYIGYDTGVSGVQQAATAAGVELPELVFFTDEQVAAMTEGDITSRTPEQSTILDAVRAKAAS